MSGRLSRALVVVSCGVLALALGDFFLQWVLFTETLLRRFLFGA